MAHLEELSRIPSMQEKFTVTERWITLKRKRRTLQAGIDPSDVVVTGLDCDSVGNRGERRGALCAESPVSSRITRFDPTGLRRADCREVKGLRPGPVHREKEIRRWTPSSTMRLAPAGRWMMRYQSGAGRGQGIGVYIGSRVSADWDRSTLS